VEPYGREIAMEQGKDWNPDLYLKFRNERTQPSIDLIRKIDISFQPKSILDIGCGPGNSSQALLQRWPNAKLTGVDNSENMIEKAKKSYPDNTWIVADVSKYTSSDKFDIVFSNAAIQWVPDHENLLKKFKLLLADKGLLAVQLPLFWDMPLGKSILKISQNERWGNLISEVSKIFTIYDYSFYYDQLSELFGSVEIWVTDYIHILDSQKSILEMIRSTALLPFYEKLRNDSDKSAFEDEIFQDIVNQYPLQKNCKVLFPFRRLFFIANK
jgi:trans-aconitate 2-methyltransferase